MADTTQLSLYLHIPFCRTRCHYCDFNSNAGLEHLHEAYAEALIQEIRLAGHTLSRPSVPTIFVGGGTPTVLPVRLLEAILGACHDAFAVDSGCETTCEANPGTVGLAYLRDLRSLGLNRLSIGVQSFNERELEWLGRTHTAGQAREAIMAARTAGFDNISLDLMFGIPGQSSSSWEDSLAGALALGSEHLSLYALTVEPGTPLSDWIAGGRRRPPDDDTAADQYEMARDLLRRQGMVHYEISNWARAKASGQDLDPAQTDRPMGGSATGPAGDGASSGDACAEPGPGLFANPHHACRHNLTYWHNGRYLGLGAGAHSYLDDRRWWNVPDVSEYIRRARAGLSAAAGGEDIGRRLAMGETMMLGLRLLVEGVSDAGFAERFGVPLADIFAHEIRSLVRQGLLDRLPDRVRLSPQGVLLGNRVFAEFLP